jgi:hypothetical protein
MSTIAPSEPMTSLADPGWIPGPLYRLTLDQYEAMVASGVFSGRARTVSDDTASRIPRRKPPWRQGLASRFLLTPVGDFKI